MKKRVMRMNNSFSLIIFFTDYPKRKIQAISIINFILPTIFSKFHYFNIINKPLVDELKSISDETEQNQTLNAGSIITCSAPHIFKLLVISGHCFTTSLVFLIKRFASSFFHLKYPAKSRQSPKSRLLSSLLILRLKPVPFSFGLISYAGVGLQPFGFSKKQ